MSDEQDDMFDHLRRAPAPRHPGKKIHLPQQVRALAEAMRRDGASAREIAKAIGISEGAVWRRLGVELERGLPGGCSRGRPTWTPSAEDRNAVISLTIAFETVQAIAKRLGVTPPTLRLHCGPELAEGRKRRRRRTGGDGGGEG